MRVVLARTAFCARLRSIRSATGMQGGDCLAAPNDPVLRRRENAASCIEIVEAHYFQLGLALMKVRRNQRLLLQPAVETRLAAALPVPRRRLGPRSCIELVEPHYLQLGLALVQPFLDKRLLLLLGELPLPL